MNKRKIETYNKIELEVDQTLIESDKMAKGLNKEYISIVNFSLLKDRSKEAEATFQKEKSLFALNRNYVISRKIQKTNDNIRVLNMKRIDENVKYLENLSRTFNPTILKLGKRKLDQYQTLPVLIDERNILVIAGAGTGKTSTILGKIKYLLLEKKVKPENILALTYTKASSEDMIKRIKGETGIDIDVFTFHKLGRSIISKVENRVPNLTQMDMMDFVSTAIKRLLEEDKTYKDTLNEYLSYHQYLSKTVFEFRTPTEYENYRRIHPYVTIKGETVKSGEEVLIANFLFTNSIDYVYEKNYIVDTTTSEYGQYNPDFYLPQYDLWIEHFAIDRNDNVPPFFIGNKGKSAKDSYLESIKWKRKTHQDNSTKLIETYSYEVYEGIVKANLEERLKAHSVEMKLLSVEELYRVLTSNKRVLNGLIELFVTVINLSKNNNVNSEEFKNTPMDEGSTYLKTLIHPIFDMYEKALKFNKEIDFSDMLNQSIQYLENGTYKSDYSYVIVDEFQDMTKLTYRFLMGLRKSNDYKLMCVGDDWQSIYRFAGSDIDYIASFDNYFGLTETFKIRKTYRFSESIAELSGRFIQKNPIQLKKDLICDDPRQSFDIGLIEGFHDKHCVDLVAQRLDDLYQGSEVLFIGRYKDDYEIFKKNQDFDVFFNQSLQAIQIIYFKRKDILITFRTAHSSKGLESDYVFILNTKDGLYGFPSKIQDNPIFNYFLGKKDQFSFSEERRLFYVALTRAKKKVYLVVNSTNKSDFITELEKDYHSKFVQESYTCPRCGAKIVKKTGKYGPFLGCTTYPACSYVKNLKGNTYVQY